MSRERKRRGRRHRRLRRVIGALVVLAVAGAAVGVLVYQARRADTYRPGEELPEITRNLAKNLPPDAPVPRFTDVTTAAGLGGFRTFAGQRSSQLPEDMGPGAAWGDFDNDGDDDLLLVSAGGALGLPPARRAPTELYENLGDGTFEKVADFPDLRIVGMGAAWGDADGDGWLDLAISGYNTLLLLRNQQGTLVPDPAFPGPPGFWAGLSWADFDRDGHLDLYVCGYVRYEESDERGGQTSEQYGAAVPYTLNPASYEPEANLLFHNNGDGTFSEEALLLGVSNPEGRSLGALWHDFDDDGWLDLYIANDISDNVLYLNRRETFEDASLAAWVADYRGAMGLAAGDWNRDGDDDLFVTHWVAQENALYDSRLQELRRARESEDAGGDAAPLRLSFTDMAAPLGLGQTALAFVGWGTEFADLDSDGWLDLVVANGSTLETDDEPRRLKPQVPFFFWNRRGEHFHDLAPLSEALSTPHVARGLAVSDYDSDGDLDILITHHGEGVQLLRNDMEQGGWLELRLRSRGPGSGALGFADGATVTARVGEVVLRRSVTGASYLSQSSRTLHLGLGAAPAVSSVEVSWPQGGTDTYSSLAAGGLWELTEGEATPRRVAAPDSAGGSRQRAAGGGGSIPPEERQRIAEFWRLQRSAMDALKRHGDIDAAVGLFRQALALDPEHEDARYYLASCLALQGHEDEALDHLHTLTNLNPQSHRAFKQWAAIKARTATSDGDLAAAQAAAERALELNKEGTGSLLLLGEIALLRGDARAAAQHLEWACRTNPRAVGGFFLRAFLAWRGGDEARSVELLEAAREARGEEWKPEGTVAEGDVEQRMHQEESPLSHFWQRWDGTPTPAAAFAPLENYLARGSSEADRDHPKG